MTKVKKLLKKAFTLVELVVVVAIIAILSGVSVAAYVGITDRANKAADQDEIAQLNLQLAAQEAIEGKNKSCFEAIQDVLSAGLDVETLSPHTKNSTYVWDQEHDRFALLDEKNEVLVEDSTLKLTSNNQKVWKLLSTYPEGEIYPVYLRSGYNGTKTITATGSLDTGRNSNIDKINVACLGNINTSDVIIRTGSFKMSLVVSGEGAPIKHYGRASQIELQSGDYEENGIVGHVNSFSSDYFKVTDTGKVFQFNDCLGETPVYKTLLGVIYNESGINQKRVINNEIYPYGEEDVSFNRCKHDVGTEIVLDNSGAYDVCKGCGAPLTSCVTESALGINVEKNLVFTKNSLTNFIESRQITLVDSSKVSEVGGTVTCYEFNNENEEYLLTNPTMTFEQSGCSHTKITCVDDGDHFHTFTCEECGYKFKDIHNFEFGKCKYCNADKHHWDEATHSCTCEAKLFPTSTNEVFKGTSVYDWSEEGHPGEKIYSAICGSDLKVWGNCYADSFLYFSDITKPSTLELDYYQYIESINVSDCEVLENSAFYCLESLKEISFGEGLTTIGKGMFHADNNLSSISFPSTLKSISGGCFGGTKIKELIFPEGFTTLGNFVTNGSVIESVYLPSTLTEMYYSSFFEQNAIVSTTPSYSRKQPLTIYYSGTINDFRTKITFHTTETYGDKELYSNFYVDDSAWNSRKSEDGKFSNLFGRFTLVTTDGTFANEDIFTA